jgi:DNA-binding winged helix-turn-helix (wHTH) protein/tetratricopeptide (TPR) repeat protein
VASAGDREGLIGGKRIVLAHEPSFTLGAVRVDPSTRRVEAHGHSEIIEPRMMQVLVVLARANGGVVTRDEIIEQCWDGRVVGEDAVNRVFFRLRQLSQKLGEGTFRIETVPRVGYRLEAERTASAPESVASPHHWSKVSRRTVGLSVVALGAAALVGKLALAGQTPKHVPLPQAKRYFDLAQDLRGQSSISQSEQAIAYFKEAVRIDPNFADAWGALAISYSGMLDWFAPRADADQLKIAARSAVNRALALDPDNLDARFVLINLDSPYGRWAEVEAGDRKLLSAHPDYGPAKMSLANVMEETGRMDDAVRVLTPLAEADPTRAAIRARLIDALLSAGRFDEAEAAIDTAGRLWPGKWGFWQLRLHLLIATGRKAEALTYIADTENRPDESIPLMDQVIQMAYAVASGDSVERETALRAVRAMGSPPGGDLAIAAMQAAFLGDVDLSLSMYEGYFLSRGPWKVGRLERRYTSGLFKQETARLRRDPRFGKLVGEMGLQRYWQLAHVTPTYLQA